MVKPLVFLKEVRSEMGLVTWPSKKEAIRLTTVVILISLAMAAFIGALDFIFTKLMELIIK